MYTSYFKKFLEQLPKSAKVISSRQPFLQLLAKILTLLALFLLFELVVTRLSAIPSQSYNEPILVVELLKRIGIIPLLSLVLLGAILAKFGALLSPWSVLQQGQLIRYFITFLAFLMAWPLTTYGFNFYFNQGHYFDRAIIILLLPLIWWRPVFIYPFLLLLFTLLWQFQQPALGGTILAHKLQVLHVLNLFAAAFIIHVVTGYRKTDTFIFLTCCLVAAAYWLPAYTKIQLDWLSHGHLYRLPLAAYAHGWLSFLSPEQIVSFAQSIAWLDWPMRIAVILIEAGCLLFMINRKVSVSLLIGVIIFHCGVFVLYGFLFWTWIMLDVALLVLLFKDFELNNWKIYSRNHIVISMVLIGFCAYWAKPPALGWLDTRLTYTYKLEAITDSGNRFQIPADFFAPYEDVFTMASFSYLAQDHGVLVGPYAVTASQKIANALNETRTAQAVFELEKSKQARGYNEMRAQRFYQFVSQFISNHNNNLTNTINLRQLAPPRQFWSFEGKDSDISKDKIAKVVIKEVTTLYDDQTLRVIRQKLLKTLKIQQ